MQKRSLFYLKQINSVTVCLSIKKSKNLEGIFDEIMFDILVLPKKKKI